MARAGHFLQRELSKGPCPSKREDSSICRSNNLWTAVDNTVTLAATVASCITPSIISKISVRKPKKTIPTGVS